MRARLGNILKFGLLSMVLSVILMPCVFAQTSSNRESVMSLLDNRFRVDPSIKKITFLIHREKSTQPVVLVRPDGSKLYAVRKYPNVVWYKESSLDIISIDHPMPGPWQAIGKVTPDNHVLLISHLALTTKRFPLRLYQGESFKFMAKLTSDGKPFKVKDFLSRVNLRVIFTKYVKDANKLEEDARPAPIVMGEFFDDGKGLDEYPNDGVFTVRLPIHVDPGKYRVRLSSGNGVFLRTREFISLVYPIPLSRTFIKSRKKNVPHKLIIEGEEGLIAPGSLAVSIEQKETGGYVSHSQAQAEAKQLHVQVNIDHNSAYGRYLWTGNMYANDAGSHRPLMFAIPEQTYSQVQGINIAAVRKAKEIERVKQRKIQAEKKLLDDRSSQRKQRLMMIGAGNVSVIILGLLLWFVRRKLKSRGKEIPEMELEVPKKK